MKNEALITLFALFIFSSCLKQYPGDSLRDCIQTKAISEQEADTMAVFSVNIVDIENFIERMPLRKKIRSIEPIVRNNEAVLFVANYNDGWEVFTGDKRLPPIVARAEYGFFSEELRYNMPLKESINWLINVVEDVKNDASIPKNENTDVWQGNGLKNHGELPNYRGENPEALWTKVKTSEQTVYYPSFNSRGPYVETHWGQGTPWNLKLWNPVLSLYHPVGCVAVAIAQLLYYYHYKLGIPSGLYHNITITDWSFCYDYSNQPCYKTTLSRSDYQDPSPRWTQMIKSINEYDITDSTSVLGASFVADLMADVGNRVDMAYFTSGSSSGSDGQRAYSALPYYGLTATISYAFNYDIAFSEIVSQKPFYMQGVDLLSGGHAWVVDGLQQAAYVTTSCYTWYMGYSPGTHPGGECATQAEATAAAIAAGLDKPDDEMETITEDISLYPALFHMNYGWNGNNDGYYLATTISIQTNNGTLEFNSNQAMLYNLRANGAN